MPVGVLVSVTALTMIAPLATDMYVPAFPLVLQDLGTTATSLQLTLTTYFVGMALGQLLGGPLSDQLGRRRPLFTALALMVVASLGCAVSPTVAVLTAARFVQGFAGGWAMVIARSVVVDVASGPTLVRSLNLVQGVAGVAPVLGPLLGAALLEHSGWRMSFWLLVAWSAVMIVVVRFVLPETLPTEHRSSGGLHHLRDAGARVLRTRHFTAHLVVMSLSMGVIFAYVAASAFVLQSMNGLTPVQYSLVFAANAVGLVGATLLSARLAGRVRTALVVAVGLAATGAAGLLLLVGAVWFDMPLWAAVPGFFVLMTAQGLIGPNAGALASEAVPDDPGTGSALLGFVQWSTAGLVAPVAGAGGAATAVPMALTVLAMVLVSAAALRSASRPVPPRHSEGAR
ncbi:multidrug effflux MFS transporter [Nocardioides aurantiacus]|uniref:DHA1 family bicyclomycin/chloramphenicol resistance-like MFS transporter n=1 Tax=Nocardioides aurantiacus TaxID=86796 RepID=A0A3N2CPC7_9ACTN|nr:multidrug effflux MFS transporter [Nocardioides aurantiacus]ROR89365.1 DHA1 family bicyclomycin/chloramphenicol resistance-like MFS transporter [Nocardioides aurantiacus]